MGHSDLNWERRLQRPLSYRLLHIPTKLTIYGAWERIWTSDTRGFNTVLYQTELLKHGVRYGTCTRFTRFTTSYFNSLNQPQHNKNGVDGRSRTYSIWFLKPTPLPLGYIDMELELRIELRSLHYKRRIIAIILFQHSHVLLEYKLHP